MKLVLDEELKKRRWSSRALQTIATKVWRQLSPDLTPKQREAANWDGGIVYVRLSHGGYSFGKVSVYVPPDTATQEGFASVFRQCLRKRAGVVQDHLQPPFLGPIPTTAVPVLRKLPPTEKNEKHLADLRAKLRVAEARVKRLHTLIAKARRKDARLRKQLTADDSTKLGTETFAERMRLRRQQAQQ